jgi:hypothetical protein
VCLALELFPGAPESGITQHPAKNRLKIQALRIPAE